MLPAALLGVALTMRWRGYAVRWGWQAAFWGMLGGYLLLRSRIVPTAPSGYQLQQLRSGSGYLIDLANYALPVASGLAGFLTGLSAGPGILLFSAPWEYMLSLAANVTAFVQARRHWVLALAGWALSFLAYLPMAWLNQFDHYHYWPMAMRTLLVVALVRVAAELTVTAVAPPGLRAPPRPAPAPGSLPRP